jgi:hypothetical protein
VAAAGRVALTRFLGDNYRSVTMMLGRAASTITHPFRLAYQSIGIGGRLLATTKYIPNIASAIRGISATFNAFRAIVVNVVRQIPSSFAKIIKLPPKPKFPTFVRLPFNMATDVLRTLTGRVVRVTSQDARTVTESTLIRAATQPTRMRFPTFLRNAARVRSARARIESSNTARFLSKLARSRRRILGNARNSVRGLKLAKRVRQFTKNQLGKKRKMNSRAIKAAAKQATKAALVKLGKKKARFAKFLRDPSSLHLLCCESEKKHVNVHRFCEAHKVHQWQIVTRN